MSRQAITCVAPIFPTPWMPESGAFLENLADVMSDEGLGVQVVAPMSLGKQLRERAQHGRREMIAAPKYRVVRPRFVELPQRLVGLNAASRRINEQLFRGAVTRGLAGCPDPVTCVYAHFWVGAFAVHRWCRARGVPYFVELQESGIRGFLDPAGDPRELRILRDSAGVVCVSQDNVRFLTETGVAPNTRVAYLPNGFDRRRFAPRDRHASRRTLGLPEHGAIVAFVGHFIERKGPLRVLKALEQTTDARGVFLGRGPQWPSGPRVLHAGPVLNAELPTWLSAADAFVLPSLAEGLANVIVEAMACGLPLVVSDRPFNRDFLTEREAVFVDPESVPSIADGLASVLSSERRRQELGAGALARSRAFSLQERVRGIREFVFAASGAGGADRCA
ncbi:MAG TPA: glycosyltransferase family 4 protein [Vicinamibacterales bacterium]|nr:glycosyltransferase family 4 protein [Vicinamibacterales bacterium]